MRNSTLSSSLICLFVVVGICAAYRPVILFHGVFSGEVSLYDLVRQIKDSHSGTEVYDIRGYDNANSLTPMWEQVAGIKAKMLPIMEKATDGVNLICYSQGGLVCRGILETTSNHNVRSFISLSSPQAGQFGDTEYMKYVFPNYTRNHLYKLLYTANGQKISIANYWRDPHHTDLYKQYSKFLYPLDNVKSSSYKSNFASVRDLVLIGGPDDGVITPWQSSHFAFYDGNENIVELENQEYYKDNSFGLKTLNSEGRVHIHNIPGVQHLQWHWKKSVFNCCIAPYLN